MAIAVRPNNVLFVGSLLCWILWKQPRKFFLTLVSTSVVVIPLLAYNIAYYGNVTGTYTMAFGTPFLTGLEGVLFSPARGLLIYFPLALFAIVGLAKGFREPTAHRTIYFTFAVFVAAGIVSVSKWNMWHGGFCYGPRLLAEIQPLMLLASIPACKTIFEERRSKFGVFGFLILFAWSSATQVLGAYAPTDWNSSPQSVNQAPGRLWDWGDNPMSRSLQLIEHKFCKRGACRTALLDPTKAVGRYRHSRLQHLIATPLPWPFNERRRDAVANRLARPVGRRYDDGPADSTPDDRWRRHGFGHGRLNPYPTLMPTVCPPSTTIACPVVKAPSVELSHNTADAISSGLPKRPIGS